MKNPIPLLRRIAWAEAVSFLALLGVAMPLKYIWDLPMAVRVVGLIHGLLFVLLCGALLRTWLVAKWPWSRSALVFVAALLPFGPFVVDRRMAGYEEEFRKSRAERVT